MVLKTHGALRISEHSRSLLINVYFYLQFRIGSFQQFSDSILGAGRADFGLLESDNFFESDNGIRFWEVEHILSAATVSPCDGHLSNRPSCHRCSACLMRRLTSRSSWTKSQ